MKHYKLVLPEHMNHHGFLFGGYLLKWIDEFAYITAHTEFPNCKLVTIALDNLVFKHRIECGEILCFDVEQHQKGRTSITYAIKVYSARQAKQGSDAASSAAHNDSPASHTFFETTITFVNVDEQGNKTALGH